MADIPASGATAAIRRAWRPPPATPTAGHAPQALGACTCLSRSHLRGPARAEGHGISAKARAHPLRIRQDEPLTRRIPRRVGALEPHPEVRSSESCESLSRRAMAATLSVATAAWSTSVQTVGRAGRLPRLPPLQAATPMANGASSPRGQPAGRHHLAHEAGRDAAQLSRRPGASLDPRLAMASRPFGGRVGGGWPWPSRVRYPREMLPRKWIPVTGPAAQSFWSPVTLAVLKALTEKDPA